MIVLAVGAQDLRDIRGAGHDAGLALVVAILRAQPVRSVLGGIVAHVRVSVQVQFAAGARLARLHRLHHNRLVVGHDHLNDRLVGASVLSLGTDVEA